MVLANERRDQGYCYGSRKRLSSTVGCLLIACRSSHAYFDGVQGTAAAAAAAAFFGPRPTTPITNDDSEWNYHQHDHPDNVQQQHVSFNSEKTHASSAEERQPSPPPPSLEHAIQFSDVALALRWTGEVNRRLLLVAESSQKTSPRRWESDDLTSTTIIPDGHPVPSAAAGEFDRRWGLLPHRIRPAVATSSTTEDRDVLTIFHAPAPRRRQTHKTHGASRWGPDLVVYLHTCANVLRIHSHDLIWTVALMYLDRASSVETVRRSPNAAAAAAAAVRQRVPFITPRTVHRLVAAAVVLATHAVRGDDVTTLVAALATTTTKTAAGTSFWPPGLSIGSDELTTMVYWMQDALGDIGLYVTSEHLADWQRTWQRRFSPGPEEGVAPSPRTARAEPDAAATLSRDATAATDDGTSAAALSWRGDEAAPSTKVHDIKAYDQRDYHQFHHRLHAS